MSNFLISYRNRADLATLKDASNGGVGDWTIGTAATLTNCQNRFLGEVTRSDGVSTTATRFDIDFGTNPNNLDYQLKVFGLCNHNLSRVAKIKITAGATQGATTFSTGWLDVWGVVFSQANVAANVWTAYSGKPTTEDVTELPNDFFYYLSTALSYRWMRIEIDDTTNTDGYVEFGRLWVGTAWMPTRGAAEGTILAWDPSVNEEESQSGTLFYGTTVFRRIMSVQLVPQDRDELMQQGLNLVKRKGATGEVVVSLDITSGTRFQSHTFLARMKSHGGAQFQFIDVADMTIEFEELK